MRAGVGDGSGINLRTGDVTALDPEASLLEDFVAITVVDPAGAHQL